MASRQAESSATAFSSTQATTTTTHRILEQPLPTIQRDNSASGSAILSALGEKKCVDMSRKFFEVEEAQRVRSHTHRRAKYRYIVPSYHSYDELLSIIDAFAFLLYAFSPVISPTSQTTWIACHTSSPSAPRCSIS
jgi:hypothetical protein